MSQTFNSNENFEVEALAKLLESLESKNIDTEKRQYIAEFLLPVLFKALPELLRAVEKNHMELDGEKHHWRYDKKLVQPIKPNQWLAQYLYRHNPKYRDTKISEKLIKTISRPPTPLDSNTPDLNNFSNAKDGQQATRIQYDNEEDVFVVGQRVRARFAGKGHLYNGVITANNGDGTFAIEYDDGDWEDSLGAQFIQSILQS